jgi:hypothetical protein
LKKSSNKLMLPFMSGQATAAHRRDMPAVFARDAPISALRSWHAVCTGVGSRGVKSMSIGAISAAASSAALQAKAVTAQASQSQSAQPTKAHHHHHHGGGGKAAASTTPGTLTSSGNTPVLDTLV